MRVGDLFKLERAFQGDGIGGPVPQAVEVVAVIDGFCQCLHLRRGHFDGFFHQRRQGIQRGSAAASQPRGQVEEGDDLISEGLGGRHADLITAGQRQPGLGGAGEGGTDHVGHAKAGHAFLLGGLQGIEHIFGLAGLADENAHVLPVHRRKILRDELRRQHRDNGFLCQLGKVHRTGQAGMITGATADEVHLARSFDLGQQFVHI